ncbi:MAG: hypothetical protein ACLFQ3_00855, partial [Thiohalorhabdus sp.]
MRRIQPGPAHRTQQADGPPAPRRLRHRLLPALALALLPAGTAVADDCPPDSYETTDNPDTDCSVSVGGSTEGKLEDVTDADWFAVDVKADQGYAFHMKGLHGDSDDKYGT